MTSISKKIPALVLLMVCLLASQCITPIPAHADFSDTIEEHVIATYAT